MLRAGAEFETLARTHSRSPQAREGGVLGTYPRGVLLPSFDRFLFTAGIGDVSEPIVEGEAVHLLQRIERWAACRQIFLKGRGDDVRAKAQELVERLRGGEDYLALAREHPDDPKSARRGGAWSIFERGADDTLLKKATFDASVGEIFGPLHSPLGFHIGKREALEVEHDPASGFAGLRESNWVRATGLLVAHEKGKEIRFGTFTVLHNGVLVQDNAEIWDGRTNSRRPVSADYKQPFFIQDHGSKVSYRNIWVREIERKPLREK